MKWLYLFGLALIFIYIVMPILITILTHDDLIGKIIEFNKKH